MTRSDKLLTNARIVLADRVIERGWVAFTDGLIVEIGEGDAPERGEDMEGDLLMPGLVELHTDHIEAHFVPRPKVFWNPLAAALSYDGQLATCGITTVLDSLRVWRDEGESEVDGQAMILANALDEARDNNLLRADHFLHLRCEIPTQYVFEDACKLADRPQVRLISLMDHTPGQRQFRDAEKLRTYYRGKSGGKTDAELDVMFAKRIADQKAYAEKNLIEVVNLARNYSIPLASHDDTTAEHVEMALRDGVSVAEFPTTREAAHALHGAGVQILMGAPNVVRGGSHSGNIAAVDLAKDGLLDILSSDYVPSSLLMGALQLPERVPGIDLAAAVRTVTKNPAVAVGLKDRGEIAKGLRGDVIQVHVTHDVPAVRSVWRQGRRVA
jgi:alpha-D-ribose 1-methylphosphonate 5-triphosphate diphosphatase